MPSHYSTIGLPVDSHDEMIELARRAALSSVSFEVDNGRYLQWTSTSGAELWVQFNTENNLIGMHPHFSGKSHIIVSLIDRIVRPKATALDGAFYGWADPATDEPGSGSYPFVFDVPDFHLHHHLSLPVTLTAQIAAFTHKVSIFDSVEAYEASQKSEFKFASQFFIPSGLFTPEGKSIDPPESYALFAGHILEAENRINELTGKSFWWVWVETLGGTLDIVIDPEILNMLPKAGAVLQGSYWLSGRIAS